MGVSNVNAAAPPAAPAAPKPAIPGEKINLRVGSFGYDSADNEGTRSKGFAFFNGALSATPRQTSWSDVVENYESNKTGGTVAYLGKAKEGTDITKMLGQGRAVRPEWANYAQFQGTKIESKGGAKLMTRSGKALEAWAKKAGDQIPNNPWGKGSDAAAAALAFEKQFMANDERALREMTDLQRRQYGAIYEIEGSHVDRYKDIGAMEGGDSWEARQAQKNRRDNPRVTSAFQFIAPTNDLNAIEQYKLLRYELRDIHTGKAVGSGLDPDYNPLGMQEADRYQPGEFIQEGAEFAQMRIAGREARQTGKSKLTTDDTTSVQL
jgi:hypothetical protein